MSFSHLLYPLSLFNDVDAALPQGDRGLLVRGYPGIIFVF